MINLTLLSAFVPTFFLVSVTPGMCMTLSLSLGMTVGVRRTLWMMAGELTGVALVAVAAVIGVAAVMLAHPAAFTAFRFVGGAYLIWLGVEMWRSRGKLAVPEVTAPDGAPEASRLQLAGQGFGTAVANPKGWAFFVALLPPFIDRALPLAPQLAILVAIILLLELVCLLLYASGGHGLSRALLRRGSGVRALNRFAGSLMVAVGLWLAFG